ncbi:MAG: chromosome segregation protein SMC [Dehalococcoidia bacterium]
MYVKRLEIQGFKSFASVTPFTFGTGVTCVVGPNGSGKTNVADAIRWVLGEHASRIIRARKTEDVVFSGSAKRPALGMAEVRLTLDNSDGWLGIEYEEVVVSRRAYRSGENEYYINQSRVRLKDVTELFLKAQVGQNSYAFMGQGLVEEVLTLRPEERRSLIEEAADVRLHRSKLDEARNRLSATRDNLERVSMIVREIEPRLRQLERQAGRAEKHAKLSAELSEALHTLFNQQWQEAQEALTAARAGCDQRKEGFDAARRNIEACEEGLRALDTAIEERRGDIAQRDETHRSLEDYRRDLQRRLTIDEERQTMLVARREELQNEVERLEEQRQELTRALDDLKTRAAAAEEHLAEARNPDAETDEAARTEARLQRLRGTLSDAERRAAQARTRLAEAEARHAALVEQRDRFAAELEAIRRERNELVGTLKSWAFELATRRRRYTQLAPTVEETSRKLSEAERLRAETTAAVGRHEDGLRILNIEIASAEQRLDAAEGTDVELPAPDAAVRALLAAGGKIADQEPPADGRIGGIIGLLGQILRVPAGLERAIEAALAEHLHGIVVESEEDALAAVELLVSEDLGRASVFPLSEVHSDHPLNLLEERGVIGVASELVRCDHRYRRLVNALLGRTIVVQNVGIGKRILRRGLGSVVTLDGILIHQQGSMTAGSAKPVRRAFTHQREVGELPAELERLRTRHRDTTTALETNQRSAAEAKRLIDELQPELERLSADLATAEQALGQQRARLPTLATKLTTLHARRAAGQASTIELGRALEAAQDEANRARTDLSGQEQTAQRLRPEVDETQAAHERLAQSSAGRDARLGALQGEVRSLRQMLSIESARQARINQQLAGRQEQVGALAEQLQTLISRLEATRQEFEAKTQEADSLREELEPARSSLTQLATRQRAMHEELAATRSAALDAERALLEAESNIRLRSEEIESLREKLDEEGFAPSAEGEVVRAENGDTPPNWLTIEQNDEDEIDVPPMRGGAPVDTMALKGRIGEIRTEIRRLGPVNEQAQVDHTESRERVEFLSSQLSDLSQAEASLMEAIGELEKIIKERFSATFDKVNTQFKHYFQTFFGGGQAELLLTRTDEDVMPGIEIMAQPPRKRVRTINMLSGGERSLTAVALLFALLQTNPSPICVLDEVDAALDEANVGRFTIALRELAERTQFVIITHNRRTIEMADTIYGVSMGEDSVTSVLSLRLSDIPKK